MSRYIDADEFRMDLLLGRTEETLYLSNMHKQMIINLLDKRKTADVVPVVRCKDCFYGKPYNEVWNKPQKDAIWCKRYEDTKEDDWFCADGEKVSE